MLRILIGLSLLITPLLLTAQELSILSWNIKHFGKSKDDKEMAVIAEIVRDYDIVAIQEVVAIDPGGAKAVARLAAELNRKGTRWDYKVSIPTFSPGKKTERYAYLWKTNKAQLVGEPWLDRNFEPIFYREPYLARFQVGEERVLIANFHARKHNDSPEEEITLFYQYPSLYPNDQIVVAGDFNTPADDDVFILLKVAGLRPNMHHQATSLKRKCNSKDEYLLHPIDYILYESTDLEVIDTGIVDFVRNCIYLKSANKISDHVPVWIKLKL